jgi:alpha,alpha-trehalase
MDAFPLHVLRDYSLIADGERGALIGPRGDIVWMCAPRWECDAVFSALIGGEGIYAITPAGQFVWGGYYEDGTLIWRSRWITGAGVTECHEALAYPATPERVVVLRRVVAREGPAKVTVLLDPRAGFGQHGLRSAHRDEHGTWTGQTGDLHLRWSGDVGSAAISRPARPAGAGHRGAARRIPRLGSRAL